MKNPFVEKINSLLPVYGFSDAHLVYDYYDTRSFGNAIAVYDLGFCAVEMIRDRGSEGLCFGFRQHMPLNLGMPRHFYGSNVVRYAIGEIDDDDFVIEPIDMDAPPESSDISVSLKYIHDHEAAIRKLFFEDDDLMEERIDFLNAAEEYVQKLSRKALQEYGEKVAPNAKATREARRREYFIEQHEKKHRRKKRNP